MKNPLLFLSSASMAAFLFSLQGLCFGIVVMRHGEADHNVLRIFNSNPKNKNYRIVHLTETGKQQARSTAASLVEKGVNNGDTRAVYVSPLSRTRETAKIVSQVLKIPGTKIRPSLFITEADAGRYEGKKISDFPWTLGDLSHGHDYGGEDDQDLRVRVRKLLDKILAECDLRSNVMIVTHGSPAQFILEYLTGNSKTTMLKTGEASEVPWEKAYASNQKFQCAGRH